MVRSAGGLVEKAIQLTARCIERRLERTGGGLEDGHAAHRRLRQHVGGRANRQERICNWSRVRREPYLLGETAAKSTSVARAVTPRRARTHPFCTPTTTAWFRSCWRPRSDSPLVVAGSARGPF
jgi:hypothetical protein